MKGRCTTSLFDTVCSFMPPNFTFFFKQILKKLTCRLFCCTWQNGYISPGKTAVLKQLWSATFELKNIQWVIWKRNREDSISPST